MPFGIHQQLKYVIKYVFVVVFSDWSRLEGWISIMYLVFYISVTLIIISLIHEVKNTRSGGYVHSQAPIPVTTHTTVVLNQQQIPLQPQYPQQGYYPAPQQPPPSYTQQQAPYNPGY